MARSGLKPHRSNALKLEEEKNVVSFILIEFKYIIYLSQFLVLKESATLSPVLRIRICRIHMFLGLPDPEPLVRDPRIRILL